jgi:hypothetical protein
MTGIRSPAVYERDLQIIRATWSLGWATSHALTMLVSPTTSVKTFAGRLTELCAAGYLRKRRVVNGPKGHVWLYGLGRRALTIDPSYGGAWRPSDTQILHTIAVVETLVALHVPGKLGKLRCGTWQGEAELRAWHEPGTAVPDLLLRWSGPSSEGTWAVEVDRGTEARGAWRRKLVRYFGTPPGALLVVTTSPQRARNLALLARELGVPALTTDRESLLTDSVLQVYDAVRGCRRSVDE